MKHGNSQRGRLPILRERLSELQGELSITDFANKLGLSRQTVGFYLNGDRVPDSETLCQICKKCDVSANWLLGLSDDPSIKSNTVDELGLSPESVENIKLLGSWDNGKDYLDGLNMLLEGTNLSMIAIKIKRLSDAVQADMSYMEQFFSENNDAKDLHSNHPSNLIAQRYGELASDLESDLVARNPELAGRISVECGRSALDMKLKDLMEYIEMQVKMGTDFVNYDMQFITGKKQW